jgi:hypothetical protein
MNRNIFLAEKSQGKKSLVRCIDKWEDNINTDLREVKCGGTQWTLLAQDGVQFLKTMSKVKDLDQEKGK